MHSYKVEFAQDAAYSAGHAENAPPGAAARTVVYAPWWCSSSVHTVTVSIGAVAVSSGSGLHGHMLSKTSALKLCLSTHVCSAPSSLSSERALFCVGTGASFCNPCAPSRSGECLACSPREKPQSCPWHPLTVLASRRLALHCLALGRSSLLVPHSPSRKRTAPSDQAAPDPLLTPGASLPDSFCQHRVETFLSCLSLRHHRFRVLLSPE